MHRRQTFVEPSALQGWTLANSKRYVVVFTMRLPVGKGYPWQAEGSTGKDEPDVNSADPAEHERDMGTATPPRVM